MHEKVDKANQVLKVADNEYSGTKSDAEVEKEEIGCISNKYESNNNPKAVGYDNGGGYKGANERTKTFENAWDKLSEDENFDKSQYQFILDKKLKVLM